MMLVKAIPYAKLTLFVALFLAFLVDQVALACSPVTPRILLRCVEDSPFITIIDSASSNSPEALHLAAEANLTAALATLEEVSDLCDVDTSAIRHYLEDSYQQWLKSDKTYGLAWHADYEPFSARRLEELQARKDDLLSCSYHEFEQVGNWLRLRSGSRSYCQLEHQGYCHPNVLSWGRLALFVFQHPGIVPLPLMVAFGLGLALPLMICTWLLKRSASAHRLLMEIVLVLPLSWFLLFGPIATTSLFQIVGWLLFCYLMARLIRFGIGLRSH